ncbi:hypothetical protein HD806DRAFT_553120 [Xylariaceae sp. AK1471]|nr:hypothetical protein HD806DRAFT_553120 [Xylariaceae sp. AK1471]
MTEYVEARSLAALNQLAANPPQYPKKPTEARQDTLTLYISRVPGTRDIILSTLKPQIKNVTAEDVASSLYYVHLQTPEDSPIVPPSGPWHSSSPRSSEESPRTQIHRKPVPAAPSQATLGTSTAPAAPSGKENQGHRVPSRKPVPETAWSGPSEHQLPTLTVMPPSTSSYRMPLGPRPLITDTTRPNVPPLHEAPGPVFHELPHVEDQRPPLPTRPGNRHPQADLTDTKRPYTPFSLTLIRRDPSSGQQWNVGKIASFQLENPDLIDDEKHHEHSPSIQIHLETSGYAKFRGMPAGPEVGLRRSLDSRPHSSSSATNSQLHGFPSSIPASGAFERQVRMAYSPSFAASLRQRFRSGSSVDEGRPPSPFKGRGHNRQGSQTSIGSFGGDFDGSDAPVITQPAPGLKPRGYMFFSPWNGRFEGSDAEHGDEKGDNLRPVTELRFNLPSNELLADKRSTEGFNRMVAKAQGLEDSDEDFHFDLSLGREKAGGGNRGKRAKMGKLIIYDEGLKMLDLVVAANVGIWWATWERTY